MAANDIVAVVEDYLSLQRKSNSNYFGLCPFHNEKSPSFSVSPAKQFFYCFGCHKGGNVIKFIQEIEHLPFAEAVRFLAKRAHIEIPEDEDPQEKQKQYFRKRLEACMLDSARYFYHAFTGPEGAEARRYMFEKRRLSPAVVKKFGIGFAGSDWDGLTKYLRSKGYSEEEILATGLAKRSSRGTPVDLFRNRVIFPVFDTFDRLVAFGGRLMGPGEPKYINSPETVLYHKGKTLFAFNFARKEKPDCLILTEGYIDTIALHEAGFSGAVASLGTALTADQATLLSRFFNKVILAYDADEAGQRAAARGMDILTRAGVEVSVLVIPDAKDPDEYIHEFGKERFAALLDRALPLLDYKLYKAREKARAATGALDILLYQEAAGDILAAEDNAVVRELYSSRVARELGVSPATMLREIERRRGEGKQEEAPVRQRKPVKKQNFQMAREEIAVIAALLEQPELSLDEDLHINAEDFADELHELIHEVLRLCREGPFSMAEFLQLAERFTPELELEKRILPLFSRMRREEMRDPKVYAAEALKAMRLNRLEDQKKELLSLWQGEGSPARKQELLEQLDKINRSMNEIKSEDR